MAIERSNSSAYYATQLCFSEPTLQIPRVRGPHASDTATGDGQCASPVGLDLEQFGHGRKLTSAHARA